MGSHYIFEKDAVEHVIASHCGMFAILEQTIPKFQELGYNLKLIKIIPDRDWKLTREQLREKADNERAAAHNLNFDLVLQNSFMPGGLEKSVQQISEFISKVISEHAQVLTKGA